MLTHRLKILAAMVLVALLAGCQTSAPYDYSALIEAKPRSILVIPPANDSIEVNAPYTFLSTISRPLAEKGYYVFPVAVIDTFMKENGLPTTAEMNSVPLAKLREVIGPDAVLYVQIHDWGQKYQIISSNTVVNASMKLVDARTGTLLWQAQAQAVQSSSDNNQGGLIGALVGAVATQIAGSIADSTPQVARVANANAIYNPTRGLLEGPYAPPKAH